MTQLLSYPLSESFAGVNSLQANGIIDSGNNLLQGIPDRLVIQGGIMRATIYDTDTVTALSVRSEITGPAHALGEYWYNFDIRLGIGFNPLLDAIMLMQIHDTPDGGDGLKAVPFSLYYTQGGDLAIYVPIQTLPTEGGNSRIIPIMKAETHRWYRCTLHVRWSTTTTGFREFYIDGVPVWREYDVPTMYTDVTGPYFKCGLYDATGNKRFGNVTAFYRNVSVYSNNDGYGTAAAVFPTIKKPLMGANA